MITGIFYYAMTKRKPITTNNNHFHQELHRTDGPAVVLSDGREFYFWLGEQLTKEQHDSKPKKYLDFYLIPYFICEAHYIVEDAKSNNPTVYDKIPHNINGPYFKRWTVRDKTGKQIQHIEYAVNGKRYSDETDWKEAVEVYKSKQIADLF